LIEDVIIALQSLFAVQVGRKDGGKQETETKISVIEELQNRFSTLDVQEKSQRFAESSEVGGASKAQSQAGQPMYSGYPIEG
jgi:hypothetical protein